MQSHDIRLAPSPNQEKALNSIIRRNQRALFDCPKAKIESNRLLIPGVGKVGFIGRLSSFDVLVCLVVKQADGWLARVGVADPAPVEAHEPSPVALARANRYTSAIIGAELNADDDEPNEQLTQPERTVKVVEPLDENWWR